MQKPAEIKYPVHSLIRERWSPRAFDDRPVEREKLLQLFEAARWAASCFNEQPWRFIIATREIPEVYQKLFDCMVEANQIWAKQAPVLMLSLAEKNFAYNQKLNRHFMHDLGLAMGNFSLQATELGLFVHQMAGFSTDKARENLKLPDDVEPAAMVAIGYAGDLDTLPEKLKTKELEPRVRKPISELVYQGEWGNPFIVP